MVKRLVLFCDGTWNVPDKLDEGKVCPSNVAKLALSVATEAPDGTPQHVFYGKGVGTGVWDRVRGGAFGAGLSEHVLDAYRFIVERYERDDQIYLFGFSRGAYTARSVAGLISNSGIVRREHDDKIGDAYDLYRRRDKPSQPNEIEAKLFRKSFGWDQDTRITFIGVWDTVGALGVPVLIPWFPSTWLHFINQRWEFHNVTLGKTVDHAYHAVAIDERRAQFKPTLWTQDEHAEDQVFEQVWFAGVHTNVGGGYVDAGLSDITLLWMKQKAAACGLAYLPDDAAHQIEPNPLGVLRNSKTGPYRILRGLDRPIGAQERGHESVHETVLARVEADPTYRPPELMKYLALPNRKITYWDQPPAARNDPDLPPLEALPA